MLSVLLTGKFILNLIEMFNCWPKVGQNRKLLCPSEVIQELYSQRPKASSLLGEEPGAL